MVREVKLQCYARELGEGNWYAHCITLCLDAIGSDYWEARKKLDAAIRSYVKTVLAQGLEKELIPRKSPLSMQAQFWYFRVLTYLRKSIYQFERSKQSSTYKCALPVTALAHA